MAFAKLLCAPSVPTSSVLFDVKQLAEAPECHALLGRHDGAIATRVGMDAK